MTTRTWEDRENTKPPFKYYLYNPSLGTILLNNAPDGWDDAGFELKRSKRYSGIFRKYAKSKLGFVKDGKAILEKIELEQGFEAQADVIIEEWDAISITYIEIFRGAIQFIDKDVDETKYTVSVSDSSFETKVINRQDEDVIMTKKTQDEIYKSFDGGAIAGFANEMQILTLPSRIESFSSEMSSDKDSTYLSNPEKDPIIPVLIKGDSSDPNVKVNENKYKNSSGAFYVNNTTVDTEINISGLVDFFIAINNTDSPSVVKVILYVINSSNNIAKQIEIPTSKVLLQEGVPFNSYTVTGNIDISEIIPKSNYIQIGIMEQGVFGWMISTGNIIDFTLRTQGGFNPLINVKAVFPAEGYSRILQKTTGAVNPFYSDYFGRKNSEPRKYTYNGTGAFRAITNGALIRGFPPTSNVSYDEAISPLIMTLKDLFDSDNAIDPIGMGIEVINGAKTVRVEALKYFFDTRVAILIDNATDIESEYNKDLIFNGAEFGYSKFETDEIADGIYDYNNKGKYSNAIISVNKTDKNISKYSASNTQINEARKITKKEKPTTDSKYDNINYRIDSIENTTGNAILNPNADEGTADWAMSTGVSVQELINNPRFVLEKLETGQVVMNQNITAIETPVISFSFAVISSDELLFTPTCRVVAILNDSSAKYLNSSGEWVDDLVNISTQSIRGVKESNLQLLEIFEIAANGVLADINFINISFNSDFIGSATGVNKYVVDDIYVSDAAKYKARTTEGFEYVRGIVNPTESYNIDLSPAKSLMRHGFRLRAPLEHKLSTSFVFSNAEKISTLVSKETGKPEVRESTDIRVNDLDAPLWGVELITFDAALSVQQKKDLNSPFADGKPKFLGLVGYRENLKQDYKYGWAEKVDTGEFQGKAKFEIRPISKYITVAEEAIAIDDDESYFTDDDDVEFIID